MKARRSHLLLVMIFMISALFQVSSGRPINEAATGGVSQQRLWAKYSPIFFRSFSSIHESAKSRGNKHGLMHVVSRRLVPCGPNPLHN
ncbi:hypothetical protein BT93_K2290 [Corymbia citriodora subsp. variegata]|nr:hypothetical protein BT93_K2290 [Corymbia citriodora subsp. variegata]